MACEDALTRIELPEDAEPEVSREAQLGDALIKLAAYLTLPGNASDVSRWLQDHESDAVLARLFYDDDVASELDLDRFATGRGRKYRSTAVEAAVWARYGDVLDTDAVRDALAPLVDLLNRTTR